MLSHQMFLVVTFFSWELQALQTNQTVHICKMKFNAITDSGFISVISIGCCVQYRDRVIIIQMTLRRLRAFEYFWVTATGAKWQPVQY